MELYHRRKRWKWIIFASAVALSVLSLAYTNYMAVRLKDEERKKIELHAMALKKFVEQENLDSDMAIVTEIITRNTTVPLIWADDRDSILATVNLDPRFERQPALAARDLQRMKDEREPIEISLVDGRKQYVYYKDSTVLRLLFWYPILQIAVVAMFVFFSYLAFSNTRKAEQDRVWVGMAKETAHQLGTPISSLMAWVELLEGLPEAAALVPEMRKDMERLDVIARRFSKIGSVPDLAPQNLDASLSTAVAYMQRRSTDKVAITYHPADDRGAQALINNSLFAWVAENLIRNAIDAMHGQGSITITAATSSKEITIDFADTGKGIPKRDFQAIFQPGYTTKQRGWGLGLTLTKRIVENYHQGKIYVKASELNKGTTFRVILPLWHADGNNGATA